MKKLKIDKTQKFLIVIIILYCIIVAIVNPAFLSLETVFDMLRSASGTFILAMGILIVMISGGIDVSSTAIAIFGGYTATRVIIELGINNIVPAFLISIGIGILLGIINAMLIHLLKLEPFIITLGTSSVFHGLMTILVGTENIGAAKLPTAFTNFGTMKLFTMSAPSGGKMGLTIFFVPVAIIIVLTWFILRKTLIGKGIFAMGCNNESAKRAGFNLLFLRMFIYAYVGALAGLMGIIYVANVNTCNPISLVGTEMSVIAAVVIGGAKTSGGQGTILGTVLGVIIFSLFNSTLVFLGFSSSWNDLFVGVVLLFSIVVTSYQERLNNRKNFIYTE